MESAVSKEKAVATVSSACNQDFPAWARQTGKFQQGWTEAPAHLRLICPPRVSVCDPVICTPRDCFSVHNQSNVSSLWVWLSVNPDLARSVSIGASERQTRLRQRIGVLRPNRRLLGSNAFHCDCERGPSFSRGLVDDESRLLQLPIPLHVDLRPTPGEPDALLLERFVPSLDFRCNPGVVQ